MGLHKHSINVGESGLKQFSLLIVEDEEHARKMLKMMLSKKYPDAGVHLAENGAIGLKMFREYQPNIVLTDNNMPIMTGLEMASEIRSHNSDTKILFMTGNLDSEFQLQLGTIGIRHCLSKPLNFKDLFTVVDGCIKQQGINRPTTCGEEIHLEAPTY